jgi:hypothetical protein
VLARLIVRNLSSPNPAPLEKEKLLVLLTNAFHGTRPE